MASWYERKVVPHIIRIGCGCAVMDEFREQVVPLASGRVLELGMGAGANLAFYDPLAVEDLVGVEPSPELRAMAGRATRPSGLSVEIVASEGEALPFDGASFDTVLCTFTLCSVRDPAAVLAEMRRVLRPGGQFLFCEHGLAPDPDVQKWQRRIEPVWKPIFGGCHLARPVRGSIEGPFAIDQWEGHYQEKGPRFAGWMEWGRALAA
jgi:ubiquinone/menaquinone biosynthesis C-methylase UbiE